MRRFFAVLLVSLFTLSCQPVKKFFGKMKAVAQCKFELIDVQKKVSLKENTNNLWNYVILFKIAAYNPTEEEISICNYKLNLYANDKWLGNIATTEKIQLTPQTTTFITAKTIISPSGALTVFWDKLFSKPIHYTVKGTFYLNLAGSIFPVEVTLFKFVDHGATKK